MFRRRSWLPAVRVVSAARLPVASLLMDGRCMRALGDSRRSRTWRRRAVGFSNSTSAARTRPERLLRPSSGPKEPSGYL